MSFEKDLQLLIDLERLIKKLGRHGWSQLEALIDRCRPAHHQHPPGHAPWLIVNGLAVRLIANQEIKMSVNVTVGHTVTFGIAFLDQRGNPMLTPPTLDAPPTWAEASTDGSVETLAVSSDGLTAVGTAIAIGLDAVTPTVMVGGVSFSASVDVVVDAEPQVFASIAVTTEVSA